eukprot:scaffold2482_cov166-Amphora_coffeaeformis.AAC.28
MSRQVSQKLTDERTFYFAIGAFAFPCHRHASTYQWWAGSPPKLLPGSSVAYRKYFYGVDCTLIGIPTITITGKERSIALGPKYNVSLGTCLSLSH